MNTTAARIPLPLFIFTPSHIPSSSYPLILVSSHPRILSSFPPIQRILVLPRILQMLVVSLGEIMVA